MTCRDEAERVPGAPAQPDPFLATLGQRVRRRRTQHRLSRRMLSERTGTSPRFLAQLEQGTGNISIVRLKAIADALDLALDELVREGDGCGDSVADPAANAGPRPDAARCVAGGSRGDWRANPVAIADLFRHAGIGEQQAVVELLLRGTRRGRRTA